MVTRQGIQTAARECLGTPYAHLGRQAGRQMDCIGVLIHVARTLGITNGYDTIQYSRLPKNFQIVRELNKAGMTTKHEEDIKPGSVGIFWITDSKRRPNQPQHAAIFTELDGEIGMVHAYLPNRKVIEHGYDGYWRKRLHCVMDFPGVE